MQTVHFVGIGGIGLSALAQWYLSMGWLVFGSDAKQSLITRDLKKRGIKISIGPQKAANLSKDLDLLIYSAAIQKNNPERREADRRRLPQKSYAEALGELTKQYKTIAVSGAHGKSTTTAVVSRILMAAGFDPTIIIGTRMPELKNNNFRAGKSEWLVLEADEYHRSFLNYHPYAAICTNLDREHLEYYKSFANIKKAFQKFFAHVENFLIINAEHAELRKLSIKSRAKVFYYHTKNQRGLEIKKLLRIPGAHNLSNAMAADMLAEKLGISKLVRNQAISGFRGTWRRFQYLGLWRGAKLYDDYAHHPTEVMATLAGAREKYPRSRIWAVFQPHLSERLALLFPEFTRAFLDADRVIVLQTYKVIGREKKIKNEKTSEDLALALKKHTPTYYAETADDVIDILKRTARRGDILIFMGAGDITDISNRLRT